MKCTDPKLGRFLRAYHVGEVLTPKDQNAFQAHLLVCDFCWKEYQKLQITDPNDKEVPED